MLRGAQWGARVRSDLHENPPTKPQLCGGAMTALCITTVSNKMAVCSRQVLFFPLHSFQQNICIQKGFKVVVGEMCLQRVFALEITEWD